MSVSEESGSSDAKSTGILDELMKEANTAESIVSSRSTTKRRPQAPKPKGYQNKETIIKRKKEYFLKKDKTITSEEAEKKAKERYQVYIEKQKERSRIRSKKHKECKEFVRSIDPKLAKYLSRDRSMRKVHFLQRKEDEIKRNHQNIHPSQASKLALQMYDEHAQKRRNRQRMYREIEKQKLRQANQDQQKDKPDE